MLQSTGSGCVRKFILPSGSSFNNRKLLYKTWTALPFHNNPQQSMTTNMSIKQQDANTGEERGNFLTLSVNYYQNHFIFSFRSRLGKSPCHHHRHKPLTTSNSQESPSTNPEPGLNCCLRKCSFNAKIEQQIGGNSMPSSCYVRNL